MTLFVSEIFASVQGESTHAGRPCVFVRLSGCNLRCLSCDTRYAWTDGRPMSLAAVLKRVRAFRINLVEVTGGEPLVQEAAIPLMKGLLADGLEVLLETNGSLDISKVPRGVKRIVDLKTPSTGMHRGNRVRNLGCLRTGDEIKFVISDRKDYLFAKGLLRKQSLDKKAAVLFSPEAGSHIAARLADWIVKDRLRARLNLQWHKILWPKRKRGV